MFKFTILAFILSTMMFFSCSDSENSNNLINPEIAETYYPMEENMMWMYDDYSDGIFTEVTVSIIGKEILNGKSYYAFQQSGANSPSYFREESGIIYALIPAISQEQEFPMYRSDYTLGEKWEINYSVNGTEITESFEVMEIGFSKEIGGKTYNELVEINKTVRMSETQVSTSYGIYSKGIGLVQSYRNNDNQMYIVDYKF